MNTVDSFMMISPFGIEEECSKFVIDDVNNPFVLADVAKVYQLYTFSCWLKSDAVMSIRIGGVEFEASTDKWLRCINTFTTAREDVVIEFLSPGTYYIYHPQLEIGNKATDWSPSPEDVKEDITDAKNNASNAQNTADGAVSRVTDVETKILLLEECIANLVTDGNFGSLMVQTENGWVFNMGPTLESLNEASENIGELLRNYADQQSILNKLQQSINDDPLTKENVEIGVFEDEPCIALSESDSEYRMLITNKRIVFIYGGIFGTNGVITNYTTLTQINTGGITTNTITVNDEIKQRGFAWVIHGQGNLGLVWKGV